MLNPSRLYRFSSVVIAFVCMLAPPHLNAQSADPGAALIKAAFWGNRAAAEKLLAQGAHADYKDPISGITPMMWALGRRNTAIAKLLLAHGANLNATDSMHHTPLWFAIYSKDRSEFEWLMTLGADAFDNQGHSVLAMRGQTAKLTELFFHCFPQPIAYDPPTGFLALYLGADPNAHDGRGETPLMFLCEDGLSKGLLTSLLSRVKVDLNAGDGNGRTVLMYSMGNSIHAETSLELIRRGADIHAMTADGWTPLSYAANGGSLTLVKALIALGAKVTPPESHFTPLMAAASARPWDDKILPVIVRLLLDHGALVNARDDNGETALSMAAFWGHVEVVKLLLKRGADPNIRANGDKSLLKIVQETEDPKRFEIDELLRLAGAKE